MKKIKNIFVLLIFIVLLQLLSCSKNNSGGLGNNSTDSSFLIKTVSSNFIDSVRATTDSSFSQYKYDAQNRCIFFTYTDFEIGLDLPPAYFTYSIVYNQQIISSTMNVHGGNYVGNVQENFTYYLNNSETLADSCHIIDVSNDNNDTSFITSHIYTYDTNGYLIQEYIYPIGSNLIPATYPPSLIKYTIVGGNTVSLSEAVYNEPPEDTAYYTITNSFLPMQISSKQNMINIGSFTVNNFIGHFNADYLQSQTSGSSIGTHNYNLGTNTYSYIFDSSNRLSIEKISGTNGITTIAYTYY